VHGVDQQPEIGPSHPTNRSHGGRQVGQRERLRELKRGLQAAVGRRFGERRELIEAAAEIGVHGDDVGPRRPEFPHHVETGKVVGQVHPGDHDEPFGQRDRHGPLLQRGGHLPSRAHVIDEGEVAVPERVGGVVWPGAGLHRDGVTAQVGRQVHEFHRGISEHGLVLDAHVVHRLPPVRPNQGDHLIRYII
jgi:hypothetical protein